MKRYLTICVLLIACVAQAAPQTRMKVCFWFSANYYKAQPAICHKTVCAVYSQPYSEKNGAALVATMAVYCKVKDTNALSFAGWVPEYQMKKAYTGNVAKAVTDQFSHTGATTNDIQFLRVDGDVKQALLKKGYIMPGEINPPTATVTPVVITR